MPTHLDRYLPYSSQGDPIAWSARRGVSPMVFVVALLLIAAFVWIVVR